MTWLGVLITYLMIGTVSPAGCEGGTMPVTTLVQGNNRFATDLYASLRARPGNLFFSPYSLSTALAMTFAGARGETAAQMARTLHLPGDQRRTHEDCRALIQQIQGDSQARPYQLLVANALWGQKGDEFLPEFLRLLEGNYGAGLHEVDFHSYPEEARQTINAWVKAQTQGTITDLIPPKLITPLTALVLTNAIYFKGSWAQPFRKQHTKTESFFLTSDQTVPVPMMHQAGRFGYLDGESYQALELPYTGRSLSMVILMPKKVDGLAELEKTLTPKAFSGLSVEQVDVALPRFKLTAECELSKVLSDMGMPQAFAGADFSGMTGARDLFISAVVHKAFVDVNEEGTEASAATAVIMERSASGIRRPVAFRADHPFVFAIRESSTGAILFLGRVTNPSG